MNREIKFRVWNGSEMLSPHAIGGFAIDDLQNGLWDAVMQFTGIQDKNGKDIYEGDIVTHQFSHLSQGVEYETQELSFQMNMSTVVYDQEVGEGYDSVEVIGNMYENPKLLKQAK